LVSMNKSEQLEFIRQYEGYEDIAREVGITSRHIGLTTPTVQIQDLYDEIHYRVFGLEEVEEVEEVEEIEEIIEEVDFYALVQGLEEHAISPDYKFGLNDLREVIGVLSRSQKTRRVKVLEIYKNDRGQYLVTYQGKQAYRPESIWTSTKSDYPYRSRKHTEPITNFLSIKARSEE
jgi:hypothetical protein